MPIQPEDQSPYQWANEHRTVGTTLDKFFLAYNATSSLNRALSAMDILRGAARELEQLLKDAREANKHFRAQGAGWALNDIAMTMPKGWMLWTTNLNGRWDVSPVHCHPNYNPRKRKNLVLCQGGATVGKLNDYLENLTANRRAFQTSGIGNGQTIAGAISGSTHGSAVRFGATPDYVVGLQLVTGRGRSLWLERASYPVMSDQFIADLNADLVRDDDIFAAAQVSLGAFGIIASLAFEAVDIYHLAFPTAREINQVQLDQELKALATVSNDDDTKWYHYEFIFNPYKLKPILVAAAKKVPYSGHIPPPKPPRWQLDGAGLIPSDNLPAWVLRLPIPRQITTYQWKWYRQHALLEDWVGTPGQVFSATSTYFKGIVETAFAVSINDAIKAIDISIDIVKEQLVPSMCQARVVHPTRSMLGFTRHSQKTVVFEFAMANGKGHTKFENELRRRFADARIAHTFHWSKNSGLTATQIKKMYGEETVRKWLAARDFVFDNDPRLKQVFDNPQIIRGGLT
jgi:FAD/FMN-containing dehydrogenase